jgi:hypothetical protein
MALIVAAAVNRMCAGQPGAAKVTARSEGWLVSGPSGIRLLCDTVEEVWTEVIRGFPDAAILRGLLKDQRAFAGDRENAGLPASTALLGSELAALRLERLTPGGTPGQSR